MKRTTPENELRQSEFLRDPPLQPRHSDGMEDRDDDDDYVE